jgi:hypothetical protein
MDTDTEEQIARWVAKQRSATGHWFLELVAGVLLLGVSLCMAWFFRDAADFLGILWIAPVTLSMSGVAAVTEALERRRVNVALKRLDELLGARAGARPPQR